MLSFPGAKSLVCVTLNNESVGIFVSQAKTQLRQVSVSQNSFEVNLAEFWPNTSNDLYSNNFSNCLFHFDTPCIKQKENEGTKKDYEKTVHESSIWYISHLWDTPQMYKKHWENAQESLHSFWKLLEVTIKLRMYPDLWVEAYYFCKSVYQKKSISEVQKDKTRRNCCSLQLDLYTIIEDLCIE